MNIVHDSRDSQPSGVAVHRASFNFSPEWAFAREVALRQRLTDDGYGKGAIAIGIGEDPPFAKRDIHHLKIFRTYRLNESCRFLTVIYRRAPSDGEGVRVAATEVGVGNCGSERGGLNVRNGSETLEDAVVERYAGCVILIFQVRQLISHRQQRGGL